MIPIPCTNYYIDWCYNAGPPATVPVLRAVGGFQVIFQSIVAGSSGVDADLFLIA